MWEGEGKRRKLRKWIWLMSSLYKNKYRIFKFWSHYKKGTKKKEEKMKEMNQFGLLYILHIIHNIYYIYYILYIWIWIWKCHKDTPCVPNKQKCHFFSFIQSQNKRVEEVLPGCGGFDISGRGCRWVNIVQTLCAHVCKWINNTCWNYSRKGEGGIKENDGGGEFKYDMFDIL
jgi:hypothetical protein